MPAHDIVRHVVEDLESLRIDYFISGSVASSYYGEARFTQDADICVHLSRAAAIELVKRATARGYYASEDAAVDAVNHGRQFNVIDAGNGFKVDLVVTSDEGMPGLRMTRRRRGEPLAGVSAWVSAPEDVILSKLEAYREGKSEKHLRDIASMFKVSGDQVDRAYCEHWAMRIGVSKYWNYVLARAEGRESGPTV